MNDKEYIENLKEIIDVYFDGSQSKFAKFIGTSSSTISRILNQTTKISDSLKGIIYEKLQALASIPDDILSEFEPMTNDIIAETSIIENEQSLVNNILQQIRNNRKANLTPDNPNSIFNLYNVLYEEINKLQYSVGAISNLDILQSFVSGFVSSAKYEIVKYICDNKYTPIKISDFIHLMLPYDISNNIYGIKRTKRDKQTIISFRTTVTNNALYPTLIRGNNVTIDCYPDKKENRYYNCISLCKAYNLMFFAVLFDVSDNILNDDKPVDSSDFKNNTNLVVHLSDNKNKRLVLDSEDIKKHHIEVIGIVRLAEY